MKSTSAASCILLATATGCAAPARSSDRPVVTEPTAEEARSSAPASSAPNTASGKPSETSTSPLSTLAPGFEVCGVRLDGDDPFGQPIVEWAAHLKVKDGVVEETAKFKALDSAIGKDELLARGFRKNPMFFTNPELGNELRVTATYRRELISYVECEHTGPPDTASLSASGWLSPAMLDRIGVGQLKHFSVEYSEGELLASAHYESLQEPPNRAGLESLSPWVHFGGEGADAELLVIPKKDSSVVHYHRGEESFLSDSADAYLDEGYLTDWSPSE